MFAIRNLTRVAVLTALFISCAHAQERDRASEFHGDAGLVQSVQAIEDAFKRRYVRIAREEGRFAPLPQGEADLFPRDGFPPSVPLTWRFAPTEDPTLFKLCAAVQARSVWEYAGILRGYRTAGMERDTGDCATAWKSPVPRTYPMTVHGFKVINARDIPLPTMLPPWPGIAGLVQIAKAGPSVLLRAAPGQWSQPFVITVGNPTAAQLGGNPTEEFMGNLVTGGVQADLVSTQVGPEFYVEHTCALLPPGSSCSLAISYLGDADRARVYDTLRLEFANGGVAFIGVKGITDSEADSSPVPIPIPDPTLPEPELPLPTDPDDNEVEPPPGCQGNNCDNGGQTPTEGQPALGPSVTLVATPGAAATRLVLFTNTTNQVLRVNHYPAVALNHPFTVQPQSDCPVAGGDLAVGATCSLLVRFSPLASAAPGTVYQDVDNLKVHWQFKACTLGPCSDPTPEGHWAGPVQVTGTVDYPASGPAALAIMEGLNLNLGTLDKGKKYTFHLTLRNTGANVLALYSFNASAIPGVTDGGGTIAQPQPGACATMQGGTECKVTITVTPGTWLPTGTVVGYRYKVNAQDRITYKSLTEPTFDIRYTVGN